MTSTVFPETNKYKYSERTVKQVNGFLIQLTSWQFKQIWIDGCLYIQTYRTFTQHQIFYKCISNNVNMKQNQLLLIEVKLITIKKDNSICTQMMQMNHRQLFHVLPPYTTIIHYMRLDKRHAWNNCLWDELQSFTCMRKHACNRILKAMSAIRTPMLIGFGWPLL